MFDTIHHFQQLSSCVGTNSCGVGTTGGLLFGATSITATNVAEGWLSDSNSTVSYAMTGSDQGMFSSKTAINNYWSDTTAMDNLRAADITATSVAGSLETIGANTAANNVRGGHTVHTATGETVISV